MKIDKDWIIIILLLVITTFLAVKVYKLNKQTDYQVEQIHNYDKNNGRYTVIFHDQKIASLEHANKELYDSIKMYKDKVDYLVKFKAKKEYIFDTIYIDTTNNKDDIKVFEYSNNKNDTLNYELKIGSSVEPNWYHLKLDVSNEFTIVNKRDNGINETTILPSDKSEISDVTVFKPKKNNFFDNIAIGPSVNVGYDVINRNFGVNVGIAVTYKIDFKK